MLTIQNFIVITFIKKRQTKLGFSTPFFALRFKTIPPKNSSKILY